MSIHYYTKDTKLNVDDTHLFDIKSKKTTFGRDLDFNHIGTTNRIIGLDKLEQQAEKSVLVRKDSYSAARNLGTSLFKGFAKDRALLSSEIRDSLTTFANLQQQQRTSSTVKILGKNIYRTIDILDATSWKKINSHIISDNFYTDKNLISGTFYNYSVTEVYQDQYGRTTETKIDKVEYTLATATATLEAKVNDMFVLINNGKGALLYWNTPIEMVMEEQLRSIIGVTVSTNFSDPRGVFVNIRLSNRTLTQTQLSFLR